MSFPAYETSAYEVAPLVQSPQNHWRKTEWTDHLRSRVELELRRTELAVHYYRIHHTLSFPLPLLRRPDRNDLPQGIEHLTYPWLIWLIWGLEDRWRLLLAQWRLLGDSAAGSVLQRELAALSDWDAFVEMDGEVGLVTGHLAGILTDALASQDGWETHLRTGALRAAHLLLERDVAPWFPRAWPNRESLTPACLHNIRVIALTRSAQLARLLRHPLAQSLEATSNGVLEAWIRFRTRENSHTEGASYDGYLMDSLTAWLEDHVEKEKWISLAGPAFRHQAEHWMHLTLPGRTDLHAPLGDTEPEMPFWVNAILRMARWYGWPDVLWTIRQMPVQRIPAAGLSIMVESLSSADGTVPVCREIESTAHALVSRTGWYRHDHAVYVSWPKVGLHHLHHDSGHFVLGWSGRFWITDPGYQQYKNGQERDYTLGPAAHNPPVVAGRVQSCNAARLLYSHSNDSGAREIHLDLSACYEKLPADAKLTRSVAILPYPTPFVVIRDSWQNLPMEGYVDTHWNAGNWLAWAFIDGWIRLSEEGQVLWIGLIDHSLPASGLFRHPGSRGPLTYRHQSRTLQGNGTHTWIFRGETEGGWTPPLSSLRSLESCFREFPPQSL